jgi:hypothetical protein
MEGNNVKFYWQLTGFSPLILQLLILNTGAFLKRKIQQWQRPVSSLSKPDIDPFTLTLTTRECGLSIVQVSTSMLVEKLKNLT